MAERLESLTIELEKRTVDLGRAIEEAAGFMAQATLLGIELAAAEQEIERLLGEAAR